MELDWLFLKKTPPHSLEAEKTVLGGILLNNKNLNVVLSLVTPNDFYKEANRIILEKIISLVDKGMPVDLVTLNEELQKAGLLDEVGGASYLSSLLDGVPQSLNIEYYAQIIREKALLRRLILSSARIISASYDQKEDAEVLLAEAQSAIIEVAEQRIKPGFVKVGDLTPQILENIRVLRERKEIVTGIPTGFRDLDSLTSGLHNSELIIVAARPSMGKTAFCLNISQYVGIRTDYSIGFFTLEMSKEQLYLRLLCSEAQVDLSKVRKGFISDLEFSRLKLGAEVLSQAKIFVDETPALTVMEMKAKARRLKMEQNLDLLFVDYIQLMRTTARFENRNQEISFISRSLKELAKELQIPVVGISQLSRAPEKGRSRPVPQLSDLRESGAIEQDADVVILIYRPEYYFPDEESLRGLAEINVAKQRNGPVGKVTMAFVREYARFVDLDFSEYRERLEEA
ncbi:MAG: replicative DNA helicase [Candidatus Aminicenantes bacterium 4484_214]|nr:replicative DNA helicase [Candidatus Aminicenantes bacterium]OQX53194.1 MAG: replicative DNA helicase [Candidatus Aminicenantes bacterium 4484_214]